MHSLLFHSYLEPFCNVPFGKPPLVCRLLKRAFNIRSTLLRYITTWDVTKAFTFIKSKLTLTDCDLTSLSYRVAIHLCLTTTSRKVTKYGVISDPYFPVFSPNAGKYGKEITPYLDTFHAGNRSKRPNY